MVGLPMKAYCLLVMLSVSNTRTFVSNLSVPFIWAIHLFILFLCLETEGSILISNHRGIKCSLGWLLEIQIYLFEHIGLQISLVVLHNGIV